MSLKISEEEIKAYLSKMVVEVNSLKPDITESKMAEIINDRLAKSKDFLVCRDGVNYNVLGVDVSYIDNQWVYNLKYEEQSEEE